MSEAADLFHDSPIVFVAISDIIIPPDRQRKNAKADDALVASIAANGLIHPIILHTDLTLVAGERRIDAHRQLNRLSIPARIYEQLTPLAAHLIELQENLARKNLTWQEEVQAVASYHAMRVENFPAWTMHGTGSDLSYSQGHISKILAVAKYLSDPDVAAAGTFNGAFNLIESRADRTIAAASARGLMFADAVSKSLPAIIPADASREEKTRLLMESMGDGIDTAVNETSDILAKLDQRDLAEAALRQAATIERDLLTDDRIIHASFLDWAETYNGPLFDILHCDFPYGKNYSGSNTRKTGKATSTPTYADSSDVYFALVDTLLSNQSRLALPQAHCIFWFDMLHYTWTVEQFTNAGWSLVQPFPLIWTKSYQGVASDTQRRPRHCYETALLFARGDRRLRKLEKDHFEEQVDEKLHISQKPLRMLRHFLSLVVDEHSAVLDPTCGSGTALAAAGGLGASRLLGVELEESHVDIARFMLDRELPK